jgi:ribonuclease T2
MSRQATRLLSVVAWLAFGLTAPALSSVPASGEFIAAKACQAYQSFRNKTNPGDVRLDIGGRYPIMELNSLDGPTWYRVRIDDATPQERWIYFECGSANVTSQGGSSSGREAGGDCKTAGLGDSYVLAVSWQPAFCEGHSGKPECSVSDPQVYQAKNFTLHGLWPNKQSCGTGYGFCGKYKERPRTFCHYDPVPMKAAILKTLGVVMPSAAHGSCLQRHEWYKHGTCQTEWDAGGYFDTAMRLLKEFNEEGVGAFMADNVGKTVTTRSFFDVVDQAFGAGAHERLHISCKGNLLVEVRIHLPATLPVDASLGALIQQAKPKFNNRCGRSFRVDAIGQQ